MFQLRGRGKKVGTRKGFCGWWGVFLLGGVGVGGEGGGNNSLRENEVEPRGRAEPLFPSQS